jgi:uncharacterized protein
MNSNTDQPTVGLAIALLAIFYTVQSVIVMPLVMGSLILNHAFAINTTLVAVGNSLALIPTLWLASLICQRPWRQLVTFGPMPWRAMPAVLLMGLGGYVLCSEVENLTRMILPMPRVVAEVFRSLFDVTRNPVGSFLALVIVAPLTEELVCRRWVLASMLRTWTPAKAILASALVFGLIHMNPWQFFYAVVLGLGFGWLYWRTRSLWLCVLLHAFNNGMSWILVYWRPEIRGLSGDHGPTAEFQPWWLDMAALGVLALGVWLCQKQTRVPRPEVTLLDAPPVIIPS